MSEFEDELGFEDCWSTSRNDRSVRSPAAGYFSVGGKDREGQGAEASAGNARASSVTDRQQGAASKPASLSAADKARLARVVRGTPEVMVKVSKPAKMDKHGNPIKVNRQTEGARVAAHLEYISRNGKIDLENGQGEILSGKSAATALYADWMHAHDEDRANGHATDRTRITTSLVLSMPGDTNAGALKDAVRALADQEFAGRHDYVMAQHTDTKHPHVHLTIRTVGHDGIKLNLRKGDLQHLRDVFASKLRQRGVEAESTPRSARGVTRKSERTPVYKIRQRGETVAVDKAKRRDVQRDLSDHGGKLPEQLWDGAIVARRNRVMRTYSAAAAVLARSPDPQDRDLARATERFVAGLTDVATERSSLARDLGRNAPVDQLGAERGRREPRSRDRGLDEKPLHPRGKNGPERLR
ncbi:relaxase/mobilization nuclease domain-containing protein [Ruegeria sp. EL01]|uniref:relaxase/mobilization nuclease domain-containing protein n=1 Tax=Ruegeria sp. EL01 TaxID=2107578 RepID=UPI000EA80F1C|nr:relaxase/mobilization nuclease domain-containing protein [Ruegeria sp. EL01]